MTASLLDIFPPEIQSLYGGVALLSAVLGLIVWGAGLKIARIAVALWLGTTAAALAAWALPSNLDISPLTAALVGFALGTLAGAITFKLLQGLILATCLSLLVGGLYYRFQLPHTPAQITANTLPAEELQIATSRLPEKAPTAAARTPDDLALLTAAQTAYTQLRQSLTTRWEALPAAHRFWLSTLTGLTALAALLLAFLFPRHTTWLATAALGTLLTTAATYALITLYAPQLAALIPGNPATLGGTLTIIMLLGLFTQRHFFWSKPKPAPQPQPAAA